MEIRYGISEPPARICLWDSSGIKELFCIENRPKFRLDWTHHEIFKRRMEAAFQPISKVDPHPDPDHALDSIRDHRGLSLDFRIKK